MFLDHLLYRKLLMTMTADSPHHPPRAALIFILVTAFLNLAGIGLLGPVSPFLVGQYTNNPDELALANGLIFTSYSLFQFLAVPGLGALSDRYGRKPVLLICLLGSSLGYLIFGLGGALWVLFLGRIIDGITGGNLGVIYAYIADITTPQERTRYYGMLGGISGLGFIVGPAIGGILAKLAGPSAPVFCAALVTLLNVVAGWFVMPESLVITKRASSIRLAQLNPFRQLWNIFQLPQLRWLLLALFTAITPFAVLQATLSVLAKDVLAWTAADVAVIFTIFGVVGIVVQGGLIRLLVRRFSELQLAIAGCLTMATGFVMIALVPATASTGLLLVATVVCALGNGLLTPSLTGLVSQVVSPREQGRVQGGSQSVQSLARVIGPIWGSFVYVSLGAGAPYATGALLLAIAAGLIVIATPTVHEYKVKRDALLSNSSPE
jgi:MFS transporter, DHA1 family, tetracycline resistance protein